MKSLNTMNGQTSTWKPLARPLFRALWIASTASHVGSYMSDVAQGWLISSLSPSPLIVALLFTAESLPFFLLGLPAGALADVVDRRRLLIVSQIAMALMVATLAVVTIGGIVTPLMVLALAFALGVMTTFNDPAWHALVPDLLPEDELTAGVTLTGVAINIARTLGPALGGLVVAAVGPGVVFGLDALSFLAVVGVLVKWRRQQPISTLPPERMIGAIRAGVRFARNSEELQGVLFRTVAFMLCGTGVMALMPLLGRETGQGAVGFGLLLGSIGIGAVIGAALLSRIRLRISPEKLVAVGHLVFAGVSITASSSRQLGVLCPVMLIGGIAWISVLSTLSIGAQEVSPPWVRARSLAVFLMIFQGSIAAGSALWGVVASHGGLNAAYWGIAIGLVLGGGLTLKASPVKSKSPDHTPAGHWPGPIVSADPPLEAGPIMVHLEYTVGSAEADAFVTAISELARSRRRYGASHWWLFHDISDPTCFIETWIEDTWADHLRNHQRVSVAHQDIERSVRALIRAGSDIVTRHYIAARRPAAEQTHRPGWLASHLVGGL